METVLRSRSAEVVIGPEQPFCIMGERINPIGRRLFSEQLRRGDLSRLRADVKEQVAGGAMVLDINMDVPHVDQADLMVRVVRTVQELCDLPLCLDSSSADVLEAGLSACQGKAMVNSVTAHDERLDAVLPLVKRHGAAVIALPSDERDIPANPRRRLELTRKILDVAVGRHGIALEDVVIDPLAVPVGADTSMVLRTLETIALIHDELGLNMTLGASNVSFGLPDRVAINAAFLPMAIACGLTSAIMDARSPRLVQTVRATDLLLDRDAWGASWIAAHRTRNQPPAP
jgi:5-methyltetrahydrofolate--homocysteine methyltransferase